MEGGGVVFFGGPRQTLLGVFGDGGCVSDRRVGASSSSDWNDDDDVDEEGDCFGLYVYNNHYYKYYFHTYTYTLFWNTENNGRQQLTTSAIQHIPIAKANQKISTDYMAGLFYFR